MRKTPNLSPSHALNRPIIHKTTSSAFAFDEGTEISRRLGFYIGHFGFLIAQQITSELSDILPICPIPFTTTWLLGLINLRGNFVPVFDLHQLLSVPKKENVKKQMLLVLGHGDSAGAIVIDDLPIPLTFSNNDELNTLPPLPGIITPYVTKGYDKNDGQLWFNFDHHGFFESLATKVAL